MSAGGILTGSFMLGAIIGYFASSESFWGAILLGALFWASAFGILLIIEKIQTAKLLAQEKEAAAKFDQELRDNTWVFPGDIFMDKCLAKRITSISSEANYLKAKLLAEELLTELEIDSCYHSRYTTREFLTPYFDRHKEAVKAKKDAEKKAKIAKAKSEDKAYQNECLRYANVFGREKCLKVCQDQINYYRGIIDACEKDEQALLSGGEATYLLGRQKESSWAIHGGIASGIAGTAAGVAVALDTMNRNEKIRAHNDSLRSNVAQMIVMGLDELRKEKQHATEMLESWEAEKDVVKLLLTEDKDEQMMLKKLNPTVIEWEPTAAGSVKMKVRFSLFNNLRVAEQLAVIDGSVKVILMANGAVVGEAICVLGYNGSYRDHTALCICTSVSKMSKNFEFRFEPNHLWALEKHRPDVILI